MRLLIIDNGATHLDRLQEICAKHEVQVINAEALADSAGAIETADAIILTGGYDAGLMWDNPIFMQEIELVRLTGKPVLGLGLGFELVCYAFGCQLHEVADREAGAAKLRPTDDGAKIFQGTDPLKVTEAPRWNIDEMPRDLVVLARSESGIEAVRHKTRPVYGLQQHPEDFVYSSDGKMVFANILDSFRRRSTA